MSVFPEELAIETVIINSYYRNNATQTKSTNFQYQLKQEIDLPAKTRCYVENVSIPHTFYSIDEGLNNFLYVRFWTGGTPSDHWINLVEGNYTGASLATHLQNQFDTTFGASKITITYLSSKGKLHFVPASGFSFHIFTDHELILDTMTWTGIAINKNNLQSANNVLRNEGWSELFDSFLPYTTETIDLLNHKVLFLHIPELATFKTLNHSGLTDMIKAIPVNASYGYTIQSEPSSNHDYVTVGNRHLSVLTIKILDGKGREVNLHGAEVSFTLRFIAET